MDHVPPMIVASMFSILAGGSLGPEAPLVGKYDVHTMASGEKVNL
jgi:hypothetical protein